MVKGVLPVNVMGVVPVLVTVIMGVVWFP